MVQDRPLRLPTLMALFLRLGALGFGGGMAVVALMEHDLVRRRRVIPEEEFLHGIALGQILGPFAVNAALFVGYRRFGLLGGLACAATFLAPSVILVILLAWLYFSYHAIPGLQPALRGLGPVVIALILGAAWSMGRKAVRSLPAAGLLVLAWVLSLWKINSLTVLVVGGLLGLWLGKERLTGKAGPKASQGSPSASGAAVLPVASPVLLAAPSLVGLAWTFLKVGFVFFGGGFVLVPVLHQTLVEGLHWLTTREFLDGVAISNLTPGPIAVLATFAGYRLQGVSGALVATLALFLPALVLMSLLSHFYSRVKDLGRAQDLLAGLSPVVVGLIFGAALLLSRGAIHGFPGILLGLLALVLLLRFHWHPAFALAMGAAAGALGWVR